MTTLELVMDAFKRTGSMRKAARELGVTVTTVSYHLSAAGYTPEKRTVLRKAKAT